MDEETKDHIDALQALCKDLGHNEWQNSIQINKLKTVIENQEKRIAKLEQELKEVYSYYGART